MQKIYNRTVLNKSILLTFDKLNNKLEKYILEKIKKIYEGKCISDGFVKKDSCKIVSYSSGTILDGDKINFNVVFECDICIPGEGLKLECLVKNVTKVIVPRKIKKINIIFSDLDALIFFII